MKNKLKTWKTTQFTCFFYRKCDRSLTLPQEVWKNFLSRGFLPWVGRFTWNTNIFFLGLSTLNFLETIVLWLDHSSETANDIGTGDAGIVPSLVLMSQIPKCNQPMSSMHVANDSIPNRFKKSKKKKKAVDSNTYCGTRIVPSLIMPGTYWLAIIKRAPTNKNLKFLCEIIIILPTFISIREKSVLLAMILSTIVMISWMLITCWEKSVNGLSS